MLLKKILIFFFLFCFGVKAIEKDVVRDNDTLEKIAKRNLKYVKLEFKNDYQSYMEKIKGWNPFVRDWNKLIPNQEIYVTYPYAPYVQGSTWAPALTVLNRNDETGDKIQLAGFYATSFGSYSENTSDQTINTTQNFPITFGLSANLANESKEHFFISSMYWAKPSSATITGNANSQTTSIAIPGELGGNLYYLYYVHDMNLGFYSGYDYESLNTFNTHELENGTAIKNLNNKIHYGTLGISKNFDIKNLSFNLKFSTSKTLISTSEAGVNPTGMKYILSLTYKTKGRFTFGGFFKHHNLTGVTKLSIDRIGFNVGYLIF